MKALTRTDLETLAHRDDGLVRCLGGLESHEAEAATPALGVDGKVNALRLFAAVLREQVTHLLLGDVVRQVADVQRAVGGVRTRSSRTTARPARSGARPALAASRRLGRERSYADRAALDERAVERAARGFRLLGRRETHERESARPSGRAASSALGPLSPCL